MQFNSLFINPVKHTDPSGHIIPALIALVVLAGFTASVVVQNQEMAAGRRREQDFSVGEALGAGGVAAGRELRGRGARVAEPEVVQVGGSGRGRAGLDIESGQGGTRHVGAETGAGGESQRADESISVAGWDADAVADVQVRGEARNSRIVRTSREVFSTQHLELETQTPAAAPLHKE